MNIDLEGLGLPKMTETIPMPDIPPPKKEHQYNTYRDIVKASEDYTEKINGLYDAIKQLHANRSEDVIACAEKDKRYSVQLLVAEYKKIRDEYVKFCTTKL